MRKFVAALGVAGAVGVTTLIVASTTGLSGLVVPAAAHDVLVSASPEEGSTVAQPPATVELTFDNAVQSEFAQVVVLDANERPYQQGEPAVAGPTVTQRVGELPNGTYTVAYRIVSSDGHPVSGDYTFTVAAAGGGAAGPPDATGTPSTTPSAAATSPPTPTSGSTPASAAQDEGLSGTAITLVVGAAAVVVAVIAFVAAGGRRRGSPSDPPTGDEPDSPGASGPKA